MTQLTALPAHKSLRSQSGRAAVSNYRASKLAVKQFNESTTLAIEDDHVFTSIRSEDATLQFLSIFTALTLNTNMD